MTGCWPCLNENEELFDSCHARFQRGEWERCERERERDAKADE